MFCPFHRFLPEINIIIIIIIIIILTLTAGTSTQSHSHLPNQAGTPPRCRRTCTWTISRQPLYYGHCCVVKIALFYLGILPQNEMHFFIVNSILRCSLLSVNLARSSIIPVLTELLIPKNNTASLAAEQVANLC